MTRASAVAIRSVLVAAVLLLVAGSATAVSRSAVHGAVMSLAVAAGPTAPAESTSPSPSATEADSASSTPSPTGLAGAPRKRVEASPPKPSSPKPKVAPPVPGPPVGAGVGIASAAAYATSRGYRVGVAVLDTQSGQVWGAGDATGWFASESVVKVFIAAKLLVTGQMSGSVEATAYKMITQSDDDSADPLYGRVGGDSIVPWAASYFHVPNLGYGPTKAGWWSNAHISAVGMVEFYAAVRANPTVWPWLSNAMAHATQFGSDSTYQWFGIPSATSGWAVKQGWGQDGDDWAASSDFNSTGFVDSDRYAVAILVKGPPSGYDSATPNMVTAIAQILMPGGVCTPGG